MTTTQALERQFFRALNSVVEPAVRSGLLSSRFAPSTLVVLESIGHVSGKTRRTPLVCYRLGDYLLLSTARGRRSFWVRNLKQQSVASGYLGGRKERVDVLTITAASTPAAYENLAQPVSALAGCLRTLTRFGWAFAILKRRR